jgi:hypothetical protein
MVIRDVSVFPREERKREDKYCEGKMGKTLKRE